MHVPGGSIRKRTWGLCTEELVQYEVVFEGRLMPGHTAQEARDNIARQRLLGPVSVSGLRFDGSLSVLYYSRSKRLAFSTLKKFRDAGIDCAVRKKRERPVPMKEGFFPGVLNYALLILLIFFAVIAFTQFMGF